MRVLLLNEVKDFGGAEVHTLQLAEGLRAAGVGVVVVGNVRSSLLERARKCDLDTAVLPMRSEMDAAAVGRLCGIIKQTRAHILHAHTMRDHVLAAAAAAITRTPLVRTQHIHFPPGASVLARMAYAHTQCIVCVSNYIRWNLLQAHFSEGRLRVVYHGIKAMHFAAAQGGELRSEWKLPPDAVVVGVVGSLFDTKGHATMLEALARLPQHVHLVVVGDGPEKSRLQRQALELHVAPRIRWGGFIDDPAEAYAAFDIVAVPSIWEEPAGYVVLEAQAAGRPVVASAVGGIPELVPEGSGGMLVPARDPQALAVALNTLVEEPELRRKLGSRGMEWVRSRFTIEHMVGATRSVYKAVLPGGQYAAVTPP